MLPGCPVPAHRNPQRLSLASGGMTHHGNGDERYNASGRQGREDCMPRLRTQALAVFVISLAGLVSCTDTKSQPTSKVVSEKSEAPVGESPEHAFAVHRYEASVANFAKLKKDLAKTEAASAAFEKSLQDDCEHDYSTGTWLLIQEKSYRESIRRFPTAISIAKRQVEVADDCLKLYRSTIDKKTVDLTTRESDGISGCRSLNSYPPEK